MEKYTINPAVKIGHVHLKVADLKRSLAFYHDLLGFDIIDQFEDDGVGAAFLSAGGYHHHIAINTWYSKDGTSPTTHHTGLFHTAILYPNRKELAKIVKRLIDADYPIAGLSDHGVSEAVYLTDPDKNGVELYVDRPKETWPRREDGSVIIPPTLQELKLEDLLAELDKEDE